MEGPSIVILTEEANLFVGKRVLKLDGNVKTIDVPSLQGQKLLQLRSWGKHFLLIFEKITLKIHFMMFGSYRIDDPRPGRIPRLAFTFKNGTLYTYACSIQAVDEELDAIYNWQTDVMAAEWNELEVVKLLKKQQKKSICDALLDQTIFSGAGNIFRNEVLFRLGVHPLTKIQTFSPAQLTVVARQMRLYALQFYIWKKQYMLRKNWQIYRKKSCPHCSSKITPAPMGALKRRTFFCATCQAPRRSIKLPQNLLKNTTDEITRLKRQLPTVKRGKTVEREH